MALACEHRLRTIAFPAISCGVYGYPMREAARIALSTTLRVLTEYKELLEVSFVLYGNEARVIYDEVFSTIE